MDQLLFLDCEPAVFIVHHPAGWLLFLFFVLLAGAIITGRMLMSIGEMVCMNGEEWRSPETRRPRIARLACYPLYDAGRLQKLYDNMPARSRIMLHKWLRYDYRFMLFLYPAMAVLGLLVTCCLYATTGSYGWRGGYYDGSPLAALISAAPGPLSVWLHYALPIMPLMCWISDALENRFALKTLMTVAEQTGNAKSGVDGQTALAIPDPTDVRWMRVFSWLKILALICYFIPLVGLLSYHIVEWFEATVLKRALPDAGPFYIYLLISAAAVLGIFTQAIIRQYRYIVP